MEKKKNWYERRKQEIIVEIEEVMYEGYAPHGVAMLIECVTDNRNRAVAEIRHTLTRFGGSMGETGSVGWQFDRKAYFSFSLADHEEDQIFELAVEGGADDVTFDDGVVEIIGEVDNFKAINDEIEAAKIETDEAGLRMFPKNEIDLNPSDTAQVLRVVEALEELEDVQNVYSNLRITDEAIQELETA